ncbi:MAG: Mfa1 family fimbria major subunit [Rikenellaceae bacterium]|nr:Mfa1 family fimbria major subunit [Rikenellaceae bacterium]
MAITSCSKDNKDGPGPGDGTEAQFKISLTLPPTVAGAVAAAPGSRADHEATAAESKIADVYIFVFDQQGNMPGDAAKGRFGPLSLTADFTLRTNTTNVFDMNDPVTTTSGIKTIYVVANLEENGINTVGTELQLLTRIENVHARGNNGGLIMYTTGTPPELSTIVFVGSTGTDLTPKSSGQENTVEVDIERSVSRVITTSPSTFVEDWTSAAKMTITVKNFLVAQDAFTSYLGENFFPAPNGNRVKTRIADVQQSAWNTVLNLYDPDDYISTHGGSRDINDYYIPIGLDPGSEPARAALPCFYIGENASNTPEAVAQHENTTYAWIQTQLTTNFSATVVNDEIVYTGGGIQENTDFYMVRVNGVRDYICWSANLDNVRSNLSAKYPGNVVTYKFPKGFVYYRVFLNKVNESGTPLGPEDKYNVYRNQFIHLDIQGLNVDGDAPGGFGGGYPGDGDNPEVPIDPLKENDPADPENPVNPNPHKPDEPIDEEDATLKVNITVKPWTYSPNGVILE